MKIILKADDFWGLGPNKKFLLFTLSRQIKVSLGIVGCGLQAMSGLEAEFIKDHKHLIEPFNHSWLHLISDKQKEYHNTTEDYQRHSIIKTQEIIKRMFDCDCETIGFPANASDETTVKILSEMPEIKKVFYPMGSWNYDQIDQIKTIIPINGYGMMEQGCKIVEVGVMRTEMLAIRPEEKIVTFQLHPSAWSDESFSNFVKCCDYLIDQGHEFIFASEYEK